MTAENVLFLVQEKKTRAKDSCCLLLNSSLSCENSPTAACFGKGEMLRWQLVHSSVRKPKSENVMQPSLFIFWQAH